MLKFKFQLQFVIHSELQKPYDHQIQTRANGNVGDSSITIVIFINEFVCEAIEC